MQIKTIVNCNGRAIKIRADEHLDWNIHSVMCQALVLTSSPWIINIEIDLRKTRVIRDSGLSLLSMLCEKSGLARNHIDLVNCRPEIRSRLMKSKLTSYLQVA